MQHKLDQYFTVKRAPKRTRTCFIYDPSIPFAEFTYETHETDQFIAVKSGISLYYRPPHVSQEKKRTAMPLCDAPLLISNLQKAIRRCDATVALSSALALIQQHPMVFLRRLPIIYVEDVTLMDSLSIAVWLMMAEQPITPLDTEHLLRMVLCLATHDACYMCDFDTERPPITPDELGSAPDAVIALYYRSLYGGMKGDMRMLQNAVEHFKTHPIHSTLSTFSELTTIPEITSLEILQEAIDFHPRPQILGLLEKRTQIEKDLIKSLIWYAESGINVRKPLTIEASEEYQQKPEWKQIAPILDVIRPWLAQ